MTREVPTMDRIVLSAIMRAALRVAERDGWGALRRHTVAAEANVSTGSVSNAYGTIDALRDAVMTAAVQQNIVSVVRDGIAARHPAALAAPASLKRAAMAV